MKNNKDYLTYDEAAKLLGISKKTLYTYIYEGKLKPIKAKGWRPCFERSYLESIRYGKNRRSEKHND